MHTGVLIYLVLALVSAISILLKRPWTTLVARRSYPRELWSNPLFLETNNVLTGLWTLVFASAAAVAWLLGSGWVYLVAFVFMFVLGRYSSKLAAWYVGYRTRPKSA